ncbi:MAG: Ribulose-phosphate 3-epimerase [uncultured Thermomicrobiales bacterium]|uniref:Ribulose-phosphate 3-epimerase n=1 Tax=uncultured Thermomicrobiales bacterium TaxID=1645740 RepID=A0A6J4UTD6_9BACT|nr:MAG: Ribulose-phosphate 3-epimerase [uncultured Thermomicrobiales bacterium]
MTPVPDRIAIRIGPSVLSANFLELGNDLREIEAAGADFVHFDVMDGRFVPNISIGLPVLAATRAGTGLPIDVHLMIVEPERWIRAFRDAGADRLTVHAEASPHLHRLVQEIESTGAIPGVALNPATPLSVVEELLPFLGQVLVMTVNPGFGGQSFIPTMPGRIERLRRMIDRVNSACRLQVDGGINRETIGAVVEAGADTIVAGTAVINRSAPIADNLAALRAGIPVRELPS